MLLTVRKFPEERKAEDPCVMPVGKVEVERVAADDRGLVEGDIVRHLIIPEKLFTRPFVLTTGAGTCPP